MSASPEFFQPSPAPDYTPSLFAVADQDDDAYYYCHTPTGADISYIRKPATCPPAPIKPRPSSACRKRLFAAAAAADIVALNFDDLEAVFRPVSLPDRRQGAAAPPQRQGQQQQAPQHQEERRHLP